MKVRSEIEKKRTKNKEVCLKQTPPLARPEFVGRLPFVIIFPQGFIVACYLKFILAWEAIVIVVWFFVIIVKRRALRVKLGSEIATNLLVLS